MVVKIKKIGSGASMKDALAAFKKQYGDAVASFGGAPVEADRLPTDVFPFDLATGGGMPRGRVTIIYGPESSGKTSLCFRAIRMNQILRPEETNVYVAIEPFDQNWARAMGVDTDKLLVLQPSFAEQAVDMVEQVLGADECGVVVVDSLAAMISTQEAEKSAEGFQPGGTSVATGKLVRRTTLQLNEAEKQGRSPTLIYVNQTRFKIGVMMGDPETMPGGNAPKFQAALWVRVRGKNITDKKVSELHPVRKEVHFVIKKNKVPIIADNGVFELVTYPHQGLDVGETNDANTLMTQLEHYGVFEKVKNGYKVGEDLFPTQQAFKDRVRLDKEYGASVRKAVIDRAMSDKEDHILQSSPKVDADGVVSEDE